MSGRLAVRIGDAERDACLGALSEHHAHGRLTTDELDKRQRAALTAVTGDDLAALLSDLPSKNRRVKSLAAPVQPWMVDEGFRGLGMAKLIAIPSALTAGGVLVADFTTDEHSFVVGFAATALGYVTHLVLSKWPSKRR